MPKGCEPYGNNNFLLNKTLTLRHKQYHPNGQLWYVIMGDATNVDSAVHLQAEFFDGWLHNIELNRYRQDRRDAIQPALQEMFAISGGEGYTVCLTGNNPLHLSFDPDFCHCDIRRASNSTVIESVRFPEVPPERLASHLQKALFRTLGQEDSTDFESVCPVVECRNKMRMEKARPLFSFQVGTQLFKHCRPYGRRNVLFNELLTLCHTVCGTDGEVKFIGVKVESSGEIVWLDEPYFSGWTGACIAK